MFMEEAHTIFKKKGSTKQRAKICYSCPINHFNPHPQLVCERSLNKDVALIKFQKYGNHSKSLLTCCSFHISVACMCRTLLLPSSKVCAQANICEAFTLCFHKRPFFFNGLLGQLLLGLSRIQAKITNCRFCS